LLLHRLAGSGPRAACVRGLLFVADTGSHDLLLLTVRQRTAHPRCRAIIDVTIYGLQGPQLSAVERYLIGVGLFHFQRLSVFRGHGVGSSSRGSMSFAYGLTAEEAGPYLKLPEGKNLAHNGTELELVDL
jgi:hypothetical protein